MERTVQDRYDARARVLKALAHPTRLFIVDQLADGPCCVCELTEMTGADVSTVSKHLSLLKSSGVIAAARKGAQVYYSLRVPCVLRFLDCVETVLRSAVAATNAGLAAAPAASPAPAAGPPPDLVPESRS